MKPLLVLGSALGAVALACLYGLVQTGAIGNRRWMQVFAIACGSLTWASILCIAIPLARLSMRRGAAKNRIETQLRKERGDYVVRQSIPDRTLVVTIVAASVLLSAFFFKFCVYCLPSQSCLPQQHARVPCYDRSVVQFRMKPRCKRPEQPHLPSPISHLRCAPEYTSRPKIRVKQGQLPVTM